MGVSKEVKGISVSFRRVAVIGAAGGGKTTIAKEIAHRIGAPHIELDALKYQKDWTVESDETFRSKVAAHVGTEQWVIDGNYADVQDLVWLRAQILVWVDFSLPVSMWRLLRRTFRRFFKDEEFANNREQLGRVFSRESILIWAIKSHRRRRKLFEELLNHPRYAHLEVIRFRSPSDVHIWLSGLSEPAEKS